MFCEPPYESRMDFIGLFSFKDKSLDVNYRVVISNCKSGASRNNHL